MTKVFVKGTILFLQILAPSTGYKHRYSVSNHSSYISSSPGTTTAAAMLRRGAYLGLVFTLILTAATQIGAQQNGECTCVHVSNTGIMSVAHVCVCVYMYVCVGV